MISWPRVNIIDLLNQKVLEIGDGYRAKNSELDRQGVPFARAGNVSGGFDFRGADFFPESNLYKVGSKISKAGDVVFTSKGTVGRFAFVNEFTQKFVYSRTHADVCGRDKHAQGRGSGPNLDGRRPQREHDQSSQPDAHPAI